MKSLKKTKDLTKMITPSELSFCEKLQRITYDTANQYCGVPLWPFPLEPEDSGLPMKTQTLTPVYEVPKDLVLGEQQLIYVGIGYGFTEPNNTAKLNAATETRLKKYNIRSVLNVAYDVNDPEALQGPSVTTEKTVNEEPKKINTYERQLAKVGLIDGPGNDIMTLVGAIYMADQLLFFPTEKQQIYEYGMTNVYPRGNLFIHCHSGGSRSVTITALYIYYRFHANKKYNTITFEEIYQQIVCYRSKAGAPNGHPTMGISTAAFEVLNTFSQLFPKPVYKLR